MSVTGTSGGYFRRRGLPKWISGFFFSATMILYALASVVTQAAENRLGVSLLVQQDHDDNYLMNSSEKQALSGLYLKPSLGYNHDDGFEKFSINVQGSAEQFNRSEYNVNNPVYSLEYKRAMERSTFNLGYDAVRQSTRISELADSGNIGTNNQQINTASGGWQYQVNHRNMFSMSGSLQDTDYESDTYVDLKNKGTQLGWQTDLNDRLSFYTVLSGTEYESGYDGNFLLAPRRIQGYLLCPPNLNVKSETNCGDVKLAGNAVNGTTTSGIQAGIKWALQEQLKFSLDAGVTYVDTKQTITTPEFSVVYGSPIDQNIFFGGKRLISSESTLTTSNMSISYVLEASTYTLSLARKIRPSSTGTLMRSESLDFSMIKSLSEINWVEIIFTAENLLTLENKTVGASVVDRSIFQSNVKYGHLLSKALTVSVTVGYRYLDANDVKPAQENIFNNEPTVANALLGVLAISYTPREWIW